MMNKSIPPSSEYYLMLQIAVISRTGMQGELEQYGSGFASKSGSYLVLPGET